MTQYARYPVGIASSNSQGTPNTIANAWPVQPTDGTNKQAFLATGEGKVSVTQALPAGAATIGAVNVLGGNATAVKVDGSAVTQPVSAASLPLPTGAATSAIQTTISGQLPASLGAKATAASLAVNIASDQTVPVSAASLPLPAGAATSALQTSGNSSLTTIATNTPAVGQALMAVSSPVVIASNQSAVPISGTVTANAGTGTFTADQTTVAAVFEAEGSVAFGSLTNAFATAYTTGGALKWIGMRNNTNQPAAFSLDAGVTTHFILDSGDSVSIDLKENGMNVANATAIKVKYTGSAPTSGSVRINGAH